MTEDEKFLNKAMFAALVGSGIVYLVSSVIFWLLIPSAPAIAFILCAGAIFTFIRAEQRRKLDAR